MMDLNNFGYGLSFIILFEFVWNLEIGLKIENIFLAIGLEFETRIESIFNLDLDSIELYL
jgi:hypothetical protein